MRLRSSASCYSVMASSFLYLKMDSSPFGSAKANLASANENSRVRSVMQAKAWLDLLSIVNASEFISRVSNKNSVAGSKCFAQNAQTIIFATLYFDKGNSRRI